LSAIIEGMLRILAVLILTLPAFAQFDPKMPPPVPEVNGPVVDDFSMHYIEIKEGTGAPAAPGKEYTVHYTGWLRDGTKFDSSVDRNEPLKFVQGKRLVIAGWEAGFEGMKVGGKRRLFIPYQLAYGEAGRDKIPPKAELIFDVELLAVTDVPAVPAAADILPSFSDSEHKVLALAKVIPEEKYSWRPAKDVRSFGEVFVHIVSANQLLLKLATSTPSADDMKAAFEEQTKLEKQTLTKDKIVAMLAESFAAVRKAIEEARPGQLAQVADLFGTATTRRGIFVSLDVHIGEHLGQAIAYARMNGITPPWSQ